MVQREWKRVSVLAVGLSFLLLLLKNLALVGGWFVEQQAFLASCGLGWLGLPVLLSLPLTVRLRRPWPRWTLALLCTGLGSSWLATWLTRELSSGFPLGRSAVVGVLVVAGMGGVGLLLLDQERGGPWD